MQAAPPTHIQAALPACLPAAVCNVPPAPTARPPPHCTACPPHTAPHRTAVIPLVMTGTAVDNNAEYANTASIMRYTLANVESGSIKLWCVVRGAPAAFALPLLLRLCCAVPAAVGACCCYAGRCWLLHIGAQFWGGRACGPSALTKGSHISTHSPIRPPTHIHGCTPPHPLTPPARPAQGALCAELCRDCLDLLRPGAALPLLCHAAPAARALWHARSRWVGGLGWPGGCAGRLAGWWRRKGCGCLTLLQPQLVVLLCSQVLNPGLHRCNCRPACLPAWQGTRRTR